jgi:glycerol-1-phosphatase
MRDLRNLDALICDMDGVLFRRDDPIEGAAEAVERFRGRGTRVLFCTNNSRYSVHDYIVKLEGFGIPCDADDVLTSAVVTAENLGARNLTGRRALVVGGGGVRDSLADMGVLTAEGEDAARADLVVVGWDPTFDYPALSRAADAVRGGALFVATNADATFPAPDGLLPGAGAILAAIETASGRRAEVMGKPHPPMTEAIAARVSGCRRVAIVGDRADTDLAAGDVMGWTKILVLSGVTSREEAATVRPVPDIVVDSLADLE